MRYIKKFNEDNEKSTYDWCKKFNLIDYNINEDMTIDVNNRVDISSKLLRKIPIQFNIVTGYFDCGINQLISLEGCPKEVGGYFYCAYNNLYTLKYCPIKIGDNFNCHDNELTDLIGGPKEVGNNFICSFNKLISLEGIPKEVGGIFICDGNPIYVVYKLFDDDYKKYKDSLDYNYWRGTDIIKLRFEEALEEIGKEVPESIRGYKYI